MPDRRDGRATVVRVTSPAPRDAWNRVLAADPSAFISQTPQWLDCLCATRGYRDASRHYELTNGRELVLPAVARSWAGVRVSEESLPYGWGYGGILSAGGTPDPAELAGVVADVARRPVLRFCVVPMPLAAAAWSAVVHRSLPRVRYLTQIIDLERGFASIWADCFASGTRRRVRKAERVGVEVREAHGGDVIDDFGAMYRRSCERWARERGHPAVLERLLSAHRDRLGQVRAVSAAMAEACTFWSATHQGQTVAVLVVLHHGCHSLSWLSAIDPELASETMASHLLYSMAIEDACGKGARFFHMGESDIGSGVAEFKARFGAISVEYDTIRMERLPLTHAEQFARNAVTAATRARFSPVTQRPTGTWRSDGAALR